ncbi:hypothetical protein H8B01_38360 [Bradyrhizobium sp. Cham227]|nr:hypothetical protein [Bradyrhizobium brasilense]
MAQQTRANGVPAFMDRDPFILLGSAIEMREQAIVVVEFRIEAAAKIGDQPDLDSGLRLGEEGR